MIFEQPPGEHSFDKTVLGTMVDDDKKDMVPNLEELIGRPQTLNEYNTML